MTLNDVKKTYTNAIDKEKAKLIDLKKNIFRIGSIRLLLVLACIGTCYTLWGDTLAIAITIGTTIMVMLFLLKYHNTLFIKRKYCELQINNAQNELKGIDYNFSAFDGAPEKGDGAHSFSMDLDLFGNNSFFQSLNRTVTFYGKDKLAETILQPCENKAIIEARQTAIKELCHKQKFIAHFRAVGQMSETNTLDIQRFSEQFMDTKLLSKSPWRFMPYIAPILFASAIVLYLLNMAPSAIITATYILLLCINLPTLNSSMKRVQILDKRVDGLDTYCNLFSIIENEKFDSPYLQQLQEQIKGSATASSAIAQLKSNSNNLFQSFTVLGFLLFNPILMWNILYNIKIEKWVTKHIADLDKWFDTIALFDSLVSFSIFAYNHPNYTYPNVSDTYMLEGKDLGHPMIRRDVCICNDISISKDPYFLVVTGANMAGKSTYLRTIGINLTLASTGAPVFASQFTFFPFRLITNLRTSDSLADNESYFFAELKRLKMIIDRLQSGEHLFIILDEILKGTNSEDKQKGSIALMKQLVSLGANGIIATHDLILGELEDEYPESVKNYRFEADIKNEQLSFTYKIREGIAKNMNACFLMKKMGITGLE